VDETEDSSVLLYDEAEDNYHEEENRWKDKRMRVSTSITVSILGSSDTHKDSDAAAGKY
jgi:hypothetical protein